MASNERTALYRLYDSSDVLLYVGITANPDTRFRQHAADKSWWPEVARKDVEWYGSRPGAEMAETAAIKLNTPHYNKQHSDNATVPVVVPKHQLVGLDLLRAKFGISRADMFSVLLDRELAARGLLGDSPCLHAMLGWPDGVTLPDECPAGCGYPLVK